MHLSASIWECFVSTDSASRHSWSLPSLRACAGLNPPATTPTLPHCSSLYETALGVLSATDLKKLSPPSSGWVAGFSGSVALPCNSLPHAPQVAPEAGFAPEWTTPLLAAVGLLAVVVSALLLVAIASLKRAQVLLKESMVRSE